MAAAGVVGCLALASVAVAKPPHPSQPNMSKKCGAHEVAYVASGPVVSWGATPGAGGTFSGPMSFTVKHANHRASSLKGTTLPLTLDATMKVRLGHGVTTPNTQDWVKVTGKVTAVAKTCTNQSGTGVVTVRRVFVHVQH
jgi:hypothetical protein